MPNREVLYNTFMEVVDNQLKENEPPETRTTLERLQKEGWSKEDSKKLIAQCVIVEVFGAVKQGKSFDAKRYKSNLENLPQEPKS